MVPHYLGWWVSSYVCTTVVGFESPRACHILLKHTYSWIQLIPHVYDDEYKEIAVESRLSKII